MYDHLNKTKILTFMIAIAAPIFSFLGFNNVSAADDFVFNIDSSSTFPLTLCSSPGSNDYPMCSDYTFVKVEPVYSVTPSNINNSYFSISGLYGTRVPTFINSYYEINEYTTGLTLASWSSNLTSLKITFTNSVSGSSAPTGSLNITENGTFDVSEVASVNVNVPQDVTEIIEDPVSNDFHKIFMVVVAGVIPAFAVFVIVWFAIDLMSSLFFGRGK